MLQWPGGDQFARAEHFGVDVESLAVMPGRPVGEELAVNLVTGEAGNFLRPYYMDQWKAWYEGYTFKLPYSEKALAASKQHELLMQ